MTEDTTYRLGHPHPTLVYVPDDPTLLDYGAWRCTTCGIEFAGGGRAFHREGCSEQDYRSCERLFGPQQVQRVLGIAQEDGEDAQWYGLSLRMLRNHFPDVLAQFTEGKEEHP